MTEANEKISMKQSVPTKGMTRMTLITKKNPVQDEVPFSYQHSKHGVRIPIYSEIYPEPIDDASSEEFNRKLQELLADTDSYTTTDGITLTLMNRKKPMTTSGERTSITVVKEEQVGNRVD